ncbi:MAG TPA: hypothetical protein PKN47_21540 [Nitrospira sp.]|nr:hypothetical protein [Nitrospira sp.]
MKGLSVSLLLLLTLFGMANQALARDMAIGLSPYQNADVAEKQIKSLVEFLAESLEPGDRCMLFDAYHVQTLGIFAVPDKVVYRQPKAKVQANRQVVAAMIQFARTAKRPDGDGEPSVIGAIRIPQALRFIGQDYPVMQDSDVILLGSPLYDDPKDQPFSMRPNHIPGDGHLMKARNVTPYGIKGQDSLLAKRRVHIAFLDNWQQDDHHSYFVQRFWTLFVEGQGGQLSSFTHDLPTLFQRVKSNAASPKHDYKVEPTDKLEMILMRPPTVKRQTSIYERPVSTAPLSAEAVRRVSNVEVGITWECGGCDLDLYGQHAPGATPLWFLRTQTKDGQYFKDFRNSPRSANGYETLAYHVTVDLNALLLAVNFYNGQSPGGVKGEVRISLNGQTYAMPFHVLAQEGNGGVGRQETLTARRANNTAWLVIDPLEVLGIRIPPTVVSQR